MKTSFVTDAFSTLGGLAGVAYGDPDFFREVQNQILAQSPTAFLDIQQPSDVFECFVGGRDAVVEKTLNVLRDEYSAGTEFTDWVDINLPNWEEVVRAQFYSALRRRMDSDSEYSGRVGDYFSAALAEVLEAEPFIAELSPKVLETFFDTPYLPVDLGLIADSINNNPRVKLSTPPPDAKISLENSIDLGLDYRGSSFATGYSTLRDYWNDIPYPGYSRPNVIPDTLRDSIEDGYVGYLSTNPLEGLFGALGAQSISSTNLGRQGSLGATVNNLNSSIISELPFFADANAFISLFGERFNGLVAYDPKTMSNGDGIDRSNISDFEGDNNDPDKGRSMLARTSQLAFNA